MSNRKVRVKLKWNGKLFDNIEVNPSDGPVVLKRRFCELTQVPCERQKIMAKGLWKGILKDTVDLSLYSWKEDMLLVMMGTPENETSISSPTNIVFVEDLSAKEKNALVVADPPGLHNLGNTCYMNATMQCLRAVPELQSSVEASTKHVSLANEEKRIAFSLKQLFQDMENNEDAVYPYSFVNSIQHAFPQFAKKDEKDFFLQQDADEFYVELMQGLSVQLKTPGPESTFGDQDNAVSAYFDIKMRTELTCLENDKEQPVISTESFRRLHCNISSETRSLEQGIKDSFESEVEKQSPGLSRNALYNCAKRISRLPKYLTIHENRFFWKRTPNSRDHQGVNCKILKDIKLPLELDVYDLCDEKLQNILKGPRDAYLKEKTCLNKKNISTKDDNAPTDLEMDSDLKEALALSMAPDEVQESMEASSKGESLGIGLPADFRGLYELFALVTHKGRSSSSGHYIGWVKRGDKGDWVCFDDETVSYCKEENILLLSGGGDRSLAYICFYRAKA